MRTLLVVAFATLAGIAAAQAQTYPSRPVTLIVPYPAGGPTDTLARVLAEAMRGALGQTVIVENVSGRGRQPRDPAGSRARRPTATRSASAMCRPTWSTARRRTSTTTW